MNTIDGKQVFSVSEVNYAAKQTLEQIEVWVMGEVTSFKKNPNWRFYYLDLKDDAALLPCVADGKVFQENDSELLGKKILAYGFLSLYEPRGQYQFKILKVEAAGEGLLQKQLEELIKKLKGEGLFDEVHKKEIPQFPKRVCLVTSHNSDAWNDFKRHSIDKFPLIELYTADVRVQGVKSVASLQKVLPQVDKMGFDVIVITRGGGSLEDLAAFNDESVARLIYAMATPTVVAIGHEANESLAEWVADVRASTPTDAANIITSGYNQVLEKLDSYKRRIGTQASFYFSTNFQRLDNNYRQLMHMKSYFKDLPHRLILLAESLRHSEKFLVTDSHNLLDQLQADINKGVKLLFSQNSQNLTQLYKSLTLLSPENTLKRGYAIVTNSDGKVIKTTSGVVEGDSIGVKLSQGKLQAQVKSKTND